MRRLTNQVFFIRRLPFSRAKQPESLLGTGDWDKHRRNKKTRRQSDAATAHCKAIVRRLPVRYPFGAREATRLGRAYGVVRRRIDYFGASELTIFSKRGSPRSG